MSLQACNGITLFLRLSLCGVGADASCFINRLTDFNNSTGRFPSHRPASAELSMCSVAVCATNLQHYNSTDLFLMDCIKFGHVKSRNCEIEARRN